MEFSLAPALHDICMSSFEIRCLRDCPNDFKPMFYRRYVGEIFALSSSPNRADEFKECFSSKHPKRNFSIEKEKNSCLPFVDVNVFCENQESATNLYKKNTFSLEKFCT